MHAIRWPLHATGLSVMEIKEMFILYNVKIKTHIYLLEWLQYMIQLIQFAILESQNTTVAIEKSSLVMFQHSTTVVTSLCVSITSNCVSDFFQYQGAEFKIWLQFTSYVTWANLSLLPSHL